MEFGIACLTNPTRVSFKFVSASMLIYLGRLESFANYLGFLDSLGLLLCFYHRPMMMILLFSHLPACPPSVPVSHPPTFFPDLPNLPSDQSLM